MEVIAVAADYEMMALNRRLAAECDEALSFSPKEIAQIVAGTAFMGLAIWLIFINNARMKVVQKQTLEVRLGINCTILTAVALFSGFFNILQLTKVDSVALHRSSSFELDLARPVEWILTCPIMQLCLVIMGGNRIPSYRRFMMPLLSVSVLLCGTASLFTEAPLQYVWFAFGVIFVAIMFYYNAVQISENSDGEESFFRGSSEYRQLTIYLILTWFPFPCWYCLSPEGFGIVKDELIINMGWVVLNIVSKFGFIIHMQMVKLKYCAKVEATRDLYGLGPTEEVPSDIELKNKLGAFEQAADSIPKGAWMSGQLTPRDDREGEAEMNYQTIVRETMVSIGMAEHAERFLKLTQEQGVINTHVLEKLTPEIAIDLNLPWNLVEACQLRWRERKMETAERNLDKVKEDPFKTLLRENREKLLAAQAMKSTKMDKMDFDFYRNGGGVATPPLAGNPITDSRIQALEDVILSLAQQLKTQQDEMMKKLDIQAAVMKDRLEDTNESVIQRMDFAQSALLQSVNSSQVLLHKMDGAQELVLQKVEAAKQQLQKMDDAQRALLDTVTNSDESSKKVLLDTMNMSSEAMLQRLSSSQETLLKKADAHHELLSRVATDTSGLVKKTDAGQELNTRQQVESEGRVSRKMEEVVQQLGQNFGKEMQKFSGSVKEDITTLVRTSQDATDALEKNNTTQEERMAELRRMSMMLMDTITGTQEMVIKSADTIERTSRQELLQPSNAGMNAAAMQVELRDIVSQQMSRVAKDLQEVLIGTEDDDSYSMVSGGMGHGRVRKTPGLLGSVAERLEQGIRHLESVSVGGGGGGGGNVEQLLRQEFAAVAMALAQQQQDVTQNVRGVFREELGKVEKQVEENGKSVTEKIQNKVDEFSTILDQGIGRLESGMDKVLSSAAADRPAAGRRPNESRG